MKLFLKTMALAATFAALTTGHLHFPEGEGNNRPDATPKFAVGIKAVSSMADENAAENDFSFTNETSSSLSFDENTASISSSAEKIKTTEPTNGGGFNLRGSYSGSQTVMEKFNAEYGQPMEFFKRRYLEYCEQFYRNYIRSPQEINFMICQNEDDEWCLNTSMNQGTKNPQRIHFRVEDFPYATAYLNQHNSAVGFGFVEAMIKDFEMNLEKITLPQGLDEKTCLKFICISISEKLAHSYYSENGRDGIALTDFFLKYAKQIAENGVLDAYIAEVESKYNFGSEVKQPMINTIAEIHDTLNLDFAMAKKACHYLNVSGTEVQSEFSAATNALASKYKEVSAIDDNYCFVTESNVTGGFYQAFFDTALTDSGTDLHSDLRLKKVDYKNGIVSLNDDDFQAHNCLNQNAMFQIIYRWCQMKKEGVAENTTFLNYLVDAHVMPQDESAAYQCMIDNKWASDESLRFLTGVTFKDMTAIGTDSQSAHNDHGSYRTETVAETTFFDGNSGKMLDDRRITASAKYEKRNWNPEYDQQRIFQDNIKGNYFFFLESVKS